MKIVIIEDEPRTARELEEMLTDIDRSLEVEAILPSVAAAIKWFSSHPAPELVFSDIQLGDGLSFEIFQEIDLKAPIIFCTAFDQYAIRAFESNSIDYLLKPVQAEMLRKSLEKYTTLRDHLLSSPSNAMKLQNAITQIGGGFRQTILVHFRERIIPVSVNNIEAIYTASGQVTIYTADKASYRVQFTIEQLQDMLNPDDFFRPSRNYLVNRIYITNIEHYFHRKLLIRTKNELPELIVVSKLKTQLFLKWMEQ